MLILAENRPEWCVADLAILMAGGVTVPAYTTSTSDDIAYLLGHADVAAVICSGSTLAKRLLPAVTQSPAVRLILFMDADAAGDAPVPTLTWADALGPRRRGAGDRACRRPARRRPRLLHLHLGHRRAAQGRHAEPSTTSWPTCAAPGGCSERIGLGQEVFLSFLPLSHAYEHTAGQFLPIAMGAEIYYAEGADTLSANLVEARPTILTCVPRLYEVLRQRIVNGVAAAGRHQRAAVQPGAGARPAALPRRAACRRTWPPSTCCSTGWCGARSASASAAGSRRWSRAARRSISMSGLFFHALGLPVLQGYGQTEASPVISANLPGRVKLDTVGPALDGVEVRIAEDGEILVRGDLVMRGYWKDEEATAQALRDGWLHTGDIGELDADGYLKITDRKKDMIVNSGGDNVAPARVEGVLLLEPEIGQALIYGDRRPHLVALIVPHQEFVRSFARSAQVRARPGGAGDATPSSRRRSARRSRRANDSPVADRARAPVRRHAGAVQRRERLDDADPQAAPAPDRQGAPGAARRPLRAGKVSSRNGNAAPGQGSGAVVET